MPTVLVIDDEPAITDNIAYALRTEGFEVTCCATGKAGLEQFRAGGIDLVVLDVGLPDINGFDLCREIRRTAATPVIFLTARAEEIDRIVGLEIGGDDYMIKPFSPRELGARAKAVLRRTGREPAAANLPAAAETPFRVDENRKVITYSGRPLDLTRYEFRLLRLLVQRPGWVFSRLQLMEAAWDDPDLSLERTVDAHIKTIRAKLHAVTPDCDPIRTHRGMGYALRETW